MTRATAAIPIAGCLLCLAACSSGAPSGAGLLSDQQALTASGASGCVPGQATLMVRSEYNCGDGLTVLTFKSAVAEMAMAQVTTSSGASHVVKQGANWLVTADN